MNSQFRNTLIAASLVIFFASSSFAQNKIGIRFFQGFQNQTSESQYLVSPNNRVDYKLTLGSVGNSQTVGLFTQFQRGFLYFQPEVLYTRYNVSYEVENFASEDAANSTETVVESRQQLDLPLNAGVKVNNFKVGVGPVFHVGQDIKSNLSDYNGISFMPKKLSAGFQGSLGYDYKIFSFDVRYQTEFNSATDHINFGGRALKTKKTPASIQIGVAIALGN